MSPRNVPGGAVQTGQKEIAILVRSEMKINRERLTVVGGLVLIILALVLDILLYRYEHAIRHWFSAL